ncbi:MAG: hypothetical protein COT16_01055 [Elusimicrobia bacterium CG08_land_8_20_14_0_20_44_26]|nr:MAG: hypothetical protein COT16_01055 [Elusimicrobia bacterium CG08_land_8_20_14_0_20_44_26]
MQNAITINRPMVLIPVERYQQLLREAGEKPTPKLLQEIKKGREEFRKRKTTKWKTLKNELKI